MIDTNTDALNKDKVNLETSKIAWQELQRFFASGLAVFVASELDLVEVAHQFSIDNKDQVAEWMQNQQVGLVPGCTSSRMARSRCRCLGSGC